MDIISFTLAKKGKESGDRANERLDTLGTILAYKGDVVNYEDLPTQNLTPGDVYLVTSTGQEYAYVIKDNVGTWEPLGPEISFPVTDVKVKNNPSDSYTSVMDGSIAKIDLSGKQNIINSDNKLALEYVDIPVFTLTSSEYNTLQSGTPLNISSSDARLNKLDSEILKFTISGTNIEFTATRKQSDNNVIVFSLDSYDSTNGVTKNSFFTFNISYPTRSGTASYGCIAVDPSSSDQRHVNLGSSLTNDIPEVGQSSTKLLVFALYTDGTLGIDVAGTKSTCYSWSQAKGKTFTGSKTYNYQGHNVTVNLSVKPTEDSVNKLMNFTYTVTSDEKLCNLTLTNSEQVQSNWTEVDNTKPEFIQNKPTNLSDFTNDKAVEYTNDSQGLTDTQKSNARKNIKAQLEVEIIDLL